MVLPVFAGGGRQFTPDLSADIALTLAETRAWPDSVVELVYEVGRENTAGARLHRP